MFARPMNLPSGAVQGNRAAERALERVLAHDDAAAQRTAGELTDTAFVTLPAWFPAAGARQVAALKRTRYLLVEERGQVSGVVPAAALAEARGDEVLSRFVQRTPVALSPDDSIEDVRTVMDQQGVDCVPVTCSGVVVGVLARDALPRRRRRPARA